MMPLLKDTDGMITIEKAVHQFDQMYNRVNDMAKIKLKCWLYYCQSRARGGKLGMTFDNYVNHMQAMDYITMVRGYVVDCSDIGGQQKAVEIILRWYR